MTALLSLLLLILYAPNYPAYTHKYLKGSVNLEKTLPLIPLRGIVIFPHIIANLDVGRPKSVLALEKALLKDNREFFVSAQRDADIEEPMASDIYDIGTIVTVRSTYKLPGGVIRVLVEGKCRATIKNFQDNTDCYMATVEPHLDNSFLPNKKISDDINLEALVHALISQFENWIKLSKKIPAEALISISLLEDIGQMCDLISSHMSFSMETKQELLGILDPIKRLERLYTLLLKEIEILKIGKEITSRVHKKMDKTQREYYLREQIKAIREELGDDEDADGDMEKYKKSLAENTFPPDVEKVLKQEIKRLAKISPSSSESNVIRTYIETLLSVPWLKHSDDALDIKRAAEILDREHYGLKDVKERILEYLAVKQLSDTHHSPIICLVGPPGVGKTSLATSISKAINRRFVRASLGGIKDEAEIRGHRRTYIGAMPGQIMKSIIQAKTNNPLFLLDEIDKMSSDFRGNPTAALLEVLDPEQNNTFLDHYLDIPFDLSNVFWVVTANNLADIPLPLRDRMEIIKLSSYTNVEKFHIAQRHLIDKQLKKSGLSKAQLQFTKEAINKIIVDYTREAGVRDLERKIASICRKAAKTIVEGEKKRLRITVKNLASFLGRPYPPANYTEKTAQVGLVIGLAWTQVGGEILPTEVNILKGKGRLILTGRLGKVMQESAQTGLSYIRSCSHELQLKPNFYEKNDIHIHLPEGAIPKDGPSAGITMTTAMISALTNQKVRSDVAMTGEITLRGRVLPVGGLKEKILAAYREKIYTIILPWDNQRDIEDIDADIRNKMTFIPVKNMKEVLEHALKNE